MISWSIVTDFVSTYKRANDSDTANLWMLAGFVYNYYLAKRIDAYKSDKTTLGYKGLLR